MRQLVGPIWEPSGGAQSEAPDVPPGPARWDTQEAHQAGCPQLEATLAQHRACLRTSWDGWGVGERSSLCPGRCPRTCVWGTCILCPVLQMLCLYGLLFPHPGFPGGSDGKESACHAEDPGATPGSGRSPGEGHGNPLQYPCLENPMGRGAWWATVMGSQRVRHDWATNT